MLCSSVSLWHGLEKLSDLLPFHLPLLTNTTELIVDARFCCLEAVQDASCASVQYIIQSCLPFASLIICFMLQLMYMWQLLYKLSQADRYAWVVQGIGDIILDCFPGK